MLKNLRKNRKGFTLIELIIVIAILAILAAVALPKLSGFTKGAKDNADIANAKTIANAVSILQAEGKITADTDATGVTLDTTATNTTADLIEKYLQNVPKTSGNGNFKVIITGGEVTVTDGTNTLFPNPTEGE